MDAVVDFVEEARSDVRIVPGLDKFDGHGGIGIRTAAGSRESGFDRVEGGVFRFRVWGWFGDGGGGAGEVGCRGRRCSRRVGGRGGGRLEGGMAFVFVGGRVLDGGGRGGKVVGRCWL